jgi:hypothetical protein
VKFKSPVYSQTSGSIAGLTYSRNKGGMYTRARAIPTNPKTAAQQAVRNGMQLTSSQWSNVLTATQRSAWEVYAANVPLTDSLGEARTVSGNAMYNRSNIIRLQAGLAVVKDGPTNFTLATLTNPSVTGVASTGVISVTFTNTDLWATAVGGALLVFVSRPQSVGITFFKGPYQYAGRINGASTAPTSPGTVTSPFALTAGQKVFVRILATNADGRLSAAWTGSFLAT